MSESKYILNRPFRSPKHGTKPNQELKFKEYKKGDIVTATYVDAESQDESGKLNTIPIVMTLDNYIIPFSAVDELKENSNSEESRYSKVDKNDETAKGKRKVVESILVDKTNESLVDKTFKRTSAEKPISQKPDAVKGILNMSKRSVNGVLIGGAIGLGVSYFTQKSILGGILIGGIAGGILGSMMKSSPKQVENKLDKFIDELKKEA